MGWIPLPSFLYLTYTAESPVASDGIFSRLRFYVLNGSAWYHYFMRRLTERPSNVFFITRNFFRP